MLQSTLTSLRGYLSQFALELKQWLSLQWALTKNWSTLDRAIDATQDSALRAILLHHVKYFAALAVVVKITKLVAAGKWDPTPRVPFTLQLTLAFLAIIPVSVVYWLTSKMMLERAPTLRTWLALHYAIYNNVFVTLTILAYPLVLLSFLMVQIMSSDAEDGMKLYILWSLKAVLVAYPWIVFAGLIRNAKRLLGLDFRGLVTHTLLANNFWFIVLYTIFFADQYAIPALGVWVKELGLPQIDINGFFKDLDDLVF